MYPKILTDKVSRLSLFAGVLFMIMASTPFLKNSVDVLNSLCKLFNTTCTTDGNVLLLLRSLVFAVAMWVSVTYVMEPVYQRMEEKVYKSM